MVALFGYLFDPRWAHLSSRTVSGRCVAATLILKWILEAFAAEEEARVALEVPELRVAGVDRETFLGHHLGRLGLAHLQEDAKGLVAQLLIGRRHPEHFLVGLDDVRGVVGREVLILELGPGIE